MSGVLTLLITGWFSGAHLVPVCGSQTLCFNAKLACFCASATCVSFDIARTAKTKQSWKQFQDLGVLIRLFLWRTWWMFIAMFHIFPKGGSLVGYELWTTSGSGKPSLKPLFARISRRLRGRDSGRLFRKKYNNTLEWCRKQLTLKDFRL